MRRRRKRQLSDGQRAAIVAAIELAEVSYRRIAAANGCSPDTVSRLARDAVDQFCGLPAVRRTRPHRCAGCGATIHTALCLACELRK